MEVAGSGHDEFPSLLFPPQCVFLHRMKDPVGQFPQGDRPAAGLLQIFRAVKPGGEPFAEVVSQIAVAALFHHLRDPLRI